MKFSRSLLLIPVIAVLAACGSTAPAAAPVTVHVTAATTALPVTTTATKTVTQTETAEPVTVTQTETATGSADCTAAIMAGNAFATKLIDIIQAQSAAGQQVAAGNNAAAVAMINEQTAKMNTLTTVDIPELGRLQTLC